MEEMSIFNSQGNPNRAARERLFQIAGADAELVEKVNELARPADVLTSFAAWSSRRRFFAWFSTKQSMLRGYLTSVHNQ
jgi:hypothetical protein